MYQYGNVFFDIFSGEYYLLIRIPTDSLEPSFALVCMNDGVLWDDPVKGAPTEQRMNDYLEVHTGRFKRSAENLSELYRMLSIDSDVPLP